MSHYLKDGEMLWPTQEGVYNVQDKLPVGTYTVGIHPMKGWYLKPVEDFKITGKIYGKITNQSERILNTFMNRPHTTGVLLNGEKGSGKTMLAKMISEKAYAMGISTLIINTPYCGDSFNTFIQEINEPCVIVFDEFEKVFNDEQQEATLTLLDGVYPTKKLFVLTVNDKYRVNQHMRNRPGRIFYMLDFTGLDADFIREYGQDRLDDKTQIEQIVRLTMMFDSFNFDMLKALVEEMNRYKESANQSLEMLNAKPYSPGSVRHSITVFKEGKKLECSLYPAVLLGNPVAHDKMHIRVSMLDKGKETNDELKCVEVDDDDIILEITSHHLKNIDPDSGTFTYVLDENEPNMTVVTFTREAQKQVSYSWSDAF